MSRLLLLLPLFCLLGSSLASAQTVWTGPAIAFVKPDFANPAEPANRDAILPGVVEITRAETQGIFNFAQEEAFSFAVSPADTEWAFANNNPGQIIEATNFAALTFDPWVTAHGLGGGTLHLDLPGLPAVVHLISADIYLDLVFTSWTPGPMAGGPGGGGFAYERSTPGGGADRDGDGVDDLDDVCPDWPDDQTDSNGDGRGDACECGDQSGDGAVNIIDILEINAAIFDPALAGPLCDANDDDACNINDILAVNAKIFGAETFCERSPRP